MTYWAGSSESHDKLLFATHQVAKGIQAGKYIADYSSDQAERFPKITAKVGSIGVVKISGSLVDGEAGWMRYYGILGYTDIANATLVLAADPEVRGLLFHIRSGGGQVTGLYETAELLKKISGLKLSATFSDETMASAAYALGSSIQGNHFVSQTAEIGSIGILQVHTEFSKALADAGITKTIMRSVENKALFNSIEPLSAEAKAQEQEQLDDLHSLFVGLVTKNRSRMSAGQLKAATDGKTFIGSRAVTAGLADKVVTYAQVLKLLDITVKRQDTAKN